MDDTKIDETRTYSAREALQFIPVVMTEPQFREYLRNDMKGANIFNAKTYTTNSQTRFVIRGKDLKEAINKAKFTSVE